MSSYLVQAGTKLYRVTTAGVATEITLPSTITLYGAGTPCRATVFGAGNSPVIIVVNGGTHDFWIDWAGNTYPLQVSSPTAAPVPAVGIYTGYTGTLRCACTFKVKDSNGATIFETGLGPISDPLALTNQSLKTNNLPVSADGVVNARGIYRTLNGGTTLYPWFDVDDNITLADDRTGPDATLSLLPTSTSLYGAPPDLKLCVQWKDRLWGVPRVAPDSVRWTEERVFYGWGATNELIAAPKNTDTYGVTALIPRRDDLGICRRKRLYKVVGNSNASFQRVGISETFGCVSQESVVVQHNVAYFLSEKGVVEWSDEGVRLISEEQVDNWFTSDDTFNRSQFGIAQGRYNPDTDAYELHLPAAGSTVLDRWVSYSLKERVWFGPHRTDAFTPVCVGTGSALKGIMQDANTLPLTVIGGNDGYLYKRDGDNVNDHLTPITMSMKLPPLSAGEPDLEKFFDRPTVHTRAESGGALTVTPQVGDLDCQADAAMTHDLMVDRETLEILGSGRYCQLTLSHASSTEQPRIYGIEIPYSFLGRR